MTPKEQLIQAIQRSPDSIVQELLEILQALQHQQLEHEVVTAEPVSQKSVLERMGGIPKHLLDIGGLSDRDHRRDLITEHLQKKHRQDS